MNEINRQAYLTAFGIENYMPRWCLPMAPDAIPCVLPALVSAQSVIHSAPSAIQSEAIAPSVQLLYTEKMGMATDVLANIGQPKKNAAPMNAATILQQLGMEKTAAVVQPFTLSVWRPVPGFLLIDSRDTRLALPTEVLLNNILRTVLGAEKIVLDEEILRWPMIENSFVSRTEDDARNELQTWLAVENELRPINRLWLLGDKASRYLLAMTTDHAAVLWQSTLLANKLLTNKLLSDKELANKEIQALVLPSLNELLQQPALKAKLWQSLL